jgi:hypothetical protein
MRYIEGGIALSVKRPVKIPAPNPKKPLDLSEGVLI